MYLQEEGLDTFVEKLTDYNFVSDRLTLSAHCNFRHCLLKARGITDSESVDEDYYDNYDQHLRFTHDSWFLPLSQYLGLPPDAVINVKEDGSFYEDGIQIEVSIKGSIAMSAPKLSRNLNRISRLASSIKEIEVRSNNHQITLVKFFLIVNARELSKELVNIQKEPETASDKKRTSSWFSQLRLVIEDCRAHYQHSVKLPVIRGQIHAQTPELELVEIARYNGVEV